MWATVIPMVMQAASTAYQATQSQKGEAVPQSSGSQRAIQEALLQNTSNQNRIAQAMARGPEDPLFKGLVEGERTRLRKAAIENMRRAMIMNQRSQRMGGLGLFANPNRRDELVAKSLLDAFVGANQGATDFARQQLGATSDVLSRGVQPLSSAGGIAESMAAREQDRIRRERQRRAQATESLFGVAQDTIPIAASMFGGGGGGSTGGVYTAPVGGSMGDGLWT